MKKTVAAAIFILVSVQAFSQSNIPGGVYTELAKFPGLSDVYVRQLPAVVSQVMAQKENQYRAKAPQNCAPQFDAQFLQTITGSDVPAVQDFESGFLVIESTFCFENTTPGKVMALFSNREFTSESISTIKDSYQKENLVCEKTSVATLGDSHYCYASDLLSEPDFISNFTFNVWNDSPENAKATVYFRFGATSVSQAGAMTKLHTQVYVRGPKLSSLQKAFGRRIITAEQKSFQEKMKQRLQ